jgi:hypothetical protein
METIYHQSLLVTAVHMKFIRKIYRLHSVVYKILDY